MEIHRSQTQSGRFTSTNFQDMDSWESREYSERVQESIARPTTTLKTINTKTNYLLSPVTQQYETPVINIMTCITLDANT